MIYTFYSFKGGVGRSMATANVAKWFYSRGLRVVMIDWDLEAPGLENYFFPPSTNKERIAANLFLKNSANPNFQPGSTAGTVAEANGTLESERKLLEVESQIGIIDLLTSYKRRFPSLPGGNGVAPIEFVDILRKALPQLGPLLYRIEPRQPETPETPETNEKEAGLWLLPAGWRSGERFATYAQQVQSFDWTDFYLSFQGGAYFEWLRNQLNEFADVVIIDSRTGVTEMGGVCAQQMADVAVCFCAPNFQNIKGLASMVASFRRGEVLALRRELRQNANPLEVVVVPTRLDTSENDLLVEFLQEFSDQFSTVPLAFKSVNHTFLDVEVPYIAKYNYREKLAIEAPDRSPKLEQAYKNLAAHLVLLAPEGSPVRLNFSDELKRVFPNLLPRVFVSYLPADGAEAAQSLRERLSQTGISSWDEPQQVASEPDDWQRPFIEKAERVIFLLTPQLLISPSLLHQWLYARQLGKLVCFYAETTPDDLPTWVKRQKLYSSETWTELVRLLESTQRAPRVPFMVPPLPANFVPRPQELGAIESLLMSMLSETQDSQLSNPGPMILGLCGPGGSGKTEMAVAACRSEAILSEFDGGIMWVSLDDASGQNDKRENRNDPNRTENLTGRIEDLIYALSGDRPGLASLEATAARLAELIEDRKLLLVIDNVWNEADLRPLLRGGRRCIRLIVTRDRNVLSRIGARPVEVGETELDEATKILASQVPLPRALAPRLASIAEQLGRLPLTLTLANSELRKRIDRGESLESSLEYVERSLHRLGIKAFDQPDAVTKSQSVTLSMALSLSRLSPDDLHRYYKLAELPFGKPITLENAVAQWYAKELQELAGENLEELTTVAENAVQQLSALSLLKYDAQTRTIYLPIALREYVSAEKQTGGPEKSAAFVSNTRDERAQNKRANIERAKLILQGAQATVQDLLDLGRRLKADTSFGYAWRILTRARSQPEAQKDRNLNLKLAHLQAVCTYKDPDLAADRRLDRALEILEIADDLETSVNQETLGIAGSINKRRWEIDGQKHHLERALAFYRRGYEQGIEKDTGYNAINTAFVLDLLAHEEELEAGKAYRKSETAEKRRVEAARIREEIAGKLEAMDQIDFTLRRQWWFLVTVAEAYFGLQRYSEARDWLRAGAELGDLPDWELQSTARQLAQLARLQTGGASLNANAEESPAWQVLRELLGDNVAALKNVFRGKVGLALSGGGFRASLYHIGVLAKLAELDVLRHVEVLSCVSGGSIIGAHYYLEVRKLLQEKADNEITRDDYVQIVDRIVKDFLDGVQTNIRTQVAASWWTNVKMIFLSNYSRTMYVGELYEKHIYSRIKDRNDDAQNEPRWLNELIVQPKGEFNSFAPKYDNWRRAAKVPLLILNATSLNTGHNWQFTATWMGEPPFAIDSDLDGNFRLRRMYYADAPGAYQRYRLGHAVAASSCVPGLFEPLPLPGLYEHAESGKRITVRLVDGGVHDNQGTASLLEQDCAVLLVSDASGQMNAAEDPSTGTIGVLKLSDTILQARVRAAQYRELAARRRTSLVQGLMFVHLKMDLDVEPIDWIGCPDPHGLVGELDSRPRALRGPLTRYGISKRVQGRLAGVRTDLDSFCDAEAYALMTSGYRMTEYAFPKNILGFELSNDPGVNWSFLAGEPTLQQTTSSSRFMKLLKVAGSSTFKIWKLARSLRVTALMLGLIVLATAALFYERWWGIGLIKITAGGLVSVIVALAAVKLLGSLLEGANYRKSMEEFAIGVGMTLLGFLAARLHLHIFDRWYLRWGKIDRMRE